MPGLGVRCSGKFEPERRKDSEPGFFVRWGKQASVMSAEGRSSFSNPLEFPMSTACVTKAKTAFAEEAGRIAAMTEREILTGSIWPLRRIPETTFDTSKGENPRTLRMQIAPPNRVEYTPILASGNQAMNFPDPTNPGQTIASYGDKTGRGCNIPAETIHWGYDEFGRCLRATALETEPMCVMDMIQKQSFSATIAALRQKLPQFAKEHFANELLRQVIRFSQNKYSVAPGMPMSTNVPYFPAIPTGGANIGVLRNMENLLRHYGWDEGANTPTVNGRAALQVYMGRDSIDFAITQRKIQKGISIQQNSTTAMDSTFGQTEVYEGIQFIENAMPTRGYLIEKTAGNFEFVEINPFVVRAGGAEGIVVDPNPAYYKSYAFVGGESRLILEVGYIIHPRAMERQAMGAIPTVDGKTFNRKFNFEVNMVPDWAIVPPECNKDGFWIQYRMLHAYAPFPYNPELMSAFLYIAATPEIIIVAPNSDSTSPTLNPVTPRPFNAPKADDCDTCADVAPERLAVLPTCTDLYPTNGVGVVRWRQLKYEVSEDAVGLTLVAERAGGSTGAASVAYATANGTATAGTEYTAASGTFNWADGEAGTKSVVVPINSTAGDDNGKTFTATLSGATGATLGTPAVTTVTILDADGA